MAVRQQKTGLAVVEFGVQPGIHSGVAGLACRRKLRRDVIGIHSFLIIRHVAGDTSGRETDVLASSRVLMALLALHDRVSAQEREAIEVILDLLYRNVPAERSMAFGAVGSHLPAVNIGVAVCAILAHFGEDRFDVALRAIHFFMHSTKGITGGVVVELGDRANRGPTRCRVAIFTWNIQRSVWASAGLPLGIGPAQAGKRHNQKQHRPAANME